MGTPRSVRWAPSPEPLGNNEHAKSSSTSPATVSSSVSSSSSSLLEFLRVIGISYLYPTLLHLGVRELAGVSALPDGTLEAQGVTQISTSMLRVKAAEYDPHSAPAGSQWDERISAEGLASFVNTTTGEVRWLRPRTGTVRSATAPGSGSQPYPTLPQPTPSLRNAAATTTAQDAHEQASEQVGNVRSAKVAAILTATAAEAAASVASASSRSRLSLGAGGGGSIVRGRASLGGGGASASSRLFAESDAGDLLFHRFHRGAPLAHTLGRGPARLGVGERYGGGVGGGDGDTAAAALDGTTARAAGGISVTGTSAPARTDISAGFLMTAPPEPTMGAYPYLAPPDAVHSAAREELPADRRMAAPYLASARRAQSSSPRVREGAAAAREFRRSLKGLVDSHYLGSPSARGGAGGGGNGNDAPYGDGSGALSAAEMYPNVYESLPSMHPRTFDALTRHSLVVNSRRVGYADARPDVRPALYMMPAAKSLYARTLDSHHVYVAPKTAVDYASTHSGAQGKAESVWAGQLRPHLHSAQDDPKAARTGAEARRMWASGGLAPSEAVTGYGYRHAAAHSMLTGSGSVFDRLTDIRGYTGTHKHRFDRDGRGRGLAGRENSISYRFLVDSMPTDEQAALPAAPLADIKLHSMSLGRR